MQIFFDLDGTLIDSSKRLYLLFQSLVPVSGFTYDDYWALKKEQIDHNSILINKFNYDNDQVAEFEKEWMLKIEDDNWLKLDEPFKGVTEMLKVLSIKHSLYIITNRQYNKPVYDQIDSFGWTTLLKYVFITNQAMDKSTIIRNYTHPDTNDWLIGDTGTDIQQGKILGTRTAAVLSGFRSKENLQRYDPDCIVDSVLDVPFESVDYK